MIDVGFTGTRQGMTDGQRMTVAALFKMLSVVAAPEPVCLHHGLCRGADEDAHAIARALGWKIHGHPASDVRESDRSALTVDRRDLDQPALRRNETISLSGILVAAPATVAEVKRSGTWATVRYGWRSSGTIVWIVTPDGGAFWTETSYVS